MRLGIPTLARASRERARAQRAGEGRLRASCRRAADAGSTEPCPHPPIAKRPLRQELRRAPPSPACGGRGTFCESQSRLSRLPLRQLRLLAAPRQLALGKLVAGEARSLRRDRLAILAGGRGPVLDRSSPQCPARHGPHRAARVRSSGRRASLPAADRRGRAGRTARRRTGRHGRGGRKAACQNAATRNAWLKPRIMDMFTSVAVATAVVRREGTSVAGFMSMILRHADRSPARLPYPPSQGMFRAGGDSCQIICS